MEKDPLTDRVIGLAIEVHRQLGPGLLESAYETCLCHELTEAGLIFERQKPIGIHYKGTELDRGFRTDLIVEENLLIELKAVEKILPVHEAQLLTYLKLSKIGTGLILNFNTQVLKNGIKRMVL
ncbi:MAG: GxxExxY protein [Rhodospirillales bacterium]|jgi:GxxExxY protein|nr:GxxExxY protein [Rhodospirillaceae bacterium]MDP6429485.1 GxxExxY protein [Rhodospirillales bacterium]MDP6643692.1 GxxExxY protein [Rhodospirillales bacterium]MDP6840852.1 GxxExxY protein [Rhodospirillales bacterium]|tara:strand:- start:384 stop:755 length:372 start_codon:yes stop_codon:yes gene_type:complete